MEVLKIIWSSIGVKLVLLIIGIFVFSSTLMLILSSYLFSAVHLTNMIVGEDKSTIVITSPSVMPHTSSIPLRTLNKTLQKLENVESVRYETLVYIIVNGELVPVRGVNITDSYYRGKIRINNSSSFAGNIIGCLWVPRGVSENIGLSLNEYFITKTVPQGKLVSLKVCGYVDAVWPYDQELITTINTANYIRGSPPGYVGIAVVKFRNMESYKKALDELGIKGSDRLMFDRVLVAIKYFGNNFNLTSYSGFSDMLLARLNLSKTFVLTMIVSLLLIISLGNILLGRILVEYSSKNIIVLHYIGYSANRTKLQLTIILLLIWVAGSFLGLSITQVLGEMIKFKLLGYTIKFTIDPALAIAALLSPLVFSIIGVSSYEVD